MCFSSSTWYALYDSTTRSPKRTHVKTSILPCDLDSRINFFHLCSRHLQPLLSMCGIPHIYAATAYGLYWGSAVPMAPHPLLCSLRRHEMFFVCPTKVLPQSFTNTRKYTKPLLLSGKDMSLILYG
jgi:hypothetical protein